MSEKKKSSWYKVLPFNTYIEFYEGTNIAKRYFVESQIFEATEEQLNKNQLSRIVEVDKPNETQENGEDDVGSNKSGRENNEESAYGKQETDSAGRDKEKELAKEALRRRGKESGKAGKPDEIF